VTRPEGWAEPRRQAPVKVLLADDQALVRAGFKLLLEAEDDITVVAEAADGAEAVTLARATRPDVVVMDIRMPQLDGIKATRELAAIRGLEQTRVLILTTYDTDAHVFEALQAGASGFLLKDSGPAELLRAIRVVAAGEALLAPRITRRLIAQFTAVRTSHQASRSGWPADPA
jgi:DNA-binding NarL/FixJ family response regulator